jgi:hypothetical protein
VADPDDAHAVVQSGAEPREEDDVKAPWHFWVLVAAVAIYLGWRLIQGIQLLVG